MTEIHATALRLELLGPPQVVRAEQTVAFDTRKAIAILSYLAVAGPTQSRDRLATLLWPEADEARAHAALRRTLSVTVAQVREALLVTRRTVSLRAAAIEVDTTEFDSLLAEGDIRSLEMAAKLYRDEFLSGFSLRDSPDFDDWQALAAERFRSRLASALEELVEAHAGAGRMARALEYARRWLALDPLHEPAHQALIRLLSWTGQRSAALKQYRACVRLLDTELGVAPLPATTHLYQEALADRLAPPVPSSGTRAVVGNRLWESSHSPVVVGSPFVGRSGQLQLLDGAWQVRGPAGRVVLVLGEPGSGKSALIGRFLESVRFAGAPLLIARCHDGEADLPYVVIADVLRSARAGAPERTADLPSSIRQELSRLVPEFAERPRRSEPTGRLAAHSGLVRFYAAVVDALQNVLTSNPSNSATGVLVVEDVQWADRGSVELLAYLVRRLRELPILVLLSRAGEGADPLHALNQAVAEATASGLAGTTELTPFAIAEVKELLDQVGGSSLDAARLLQETHGLPLLVVEYAKALIAAGNVEDWSHDAPPNSVRELLAARLAAAGEPSLQILAAAAVLGDDFEAELLRSVSGRGESEIVEALDIALRHGLLVEIASGEPNGSPRYDFPYEALRRVAKDATTLARRRLVHGRAAEALSHLYERNPGSVRAATVASHLGLSGREASAARWWWLAAERSSRLYAHAEAVRHLERALALGYPPVPALIATGVAQTALGHYGEALVSFEAAAAQIGSDDPALAEVEHRLAEIHHRLGDWPLARTHLTSALALLPEADASHRARALADLALVAYRSLELDEAQALAEEALSKSATAGDSEARAQACNVLGVIAARHGDPVRAEILLRESLEEARQLQDPGASVAALNNLSRLLADGRHLDQALEAAEEALQLGSGRADQHHVAALHSNLADLLEASGRHDEAQEHIKESALRFSSLDVGGEIRPEIWALVEW
jgi:DNA-binding SARP family transcriptional activator/predicted ATPase